MSEFIIPEDTKILCLGLKCGKAPYGFVGICDTGRIGVFGNTPYAFYAFVVFDIFFHDIHIRPIGIHRYIYHIDTEISRNPEMSVIAGHGTQEFYFFKLSPRSASGNAFCISVRNGIKHHIKAGVSSGNNIFR